MTERKFTQDEADRVMRYIVGDKAGAYTMEDEKLMTSIINETLTKDTINETKDVITKTEEILRRLQIALLEKKRVRAAAEEVDKVIDAVAILHPTERHHYRIDAERKAGFNTVSISVFKHGILENQFKKYLEVK